MIPDLVLFPRTKPEIEKTLEKIDQIMHYRIHPSVKLIHERSDEGHSLQNNYYFINSALIALQTITTGYNRSFIAHP